MTKPSVLSQERIREYYQSQKQLNISDIDYGADLTAIIALLALLRTWSTEKLDCVQPLNEMPSILCPTIDMTSSTVGNIYHAGMINIDTTRTPVNAFVEKDNQSINWYTYHTVLQPALCTNDRVLDIPETIAVLKSLLPNGLQEWQKKQLPELMREIAIDECVQYHQYILNKYNFDESVGEKTRLIFEELLETMSVSHIVPCIWFAAKSAAAFYQSSSCKSKKHAYNTIQGHIRETAAKRMSGELQNKPFNRGTGCERSEISIELYTSLGYDGDVGFTERLADIEIPEAWETTLDDPEMETGAVFSTHEKLLLEESSFYECTDSWWERPLVTLDREVVVRKLLSSPQYEVIVKEVANVKDPVIIASALMNDFTTVAVFIDALEKSDDFEHSKREKEASAE